MCGRFNITDSPLTQELLKTLGIDIGPLPKPRYNIAPTERVAVVQVLDCKRALTRMRWWLVPSWSDVRSQKYVMFNARSETLSKNRAFRGPFKHKRTVIPVSNFTKWQKLASSRT